MLAKDDSLAYVHEPFNINRNNLLGLENWFTYISHKNEKKHISKMENILNLKYPLVRAIKESKSFRDFGRALRDYFIITKSRLNNCRPLIKDPIAVFSAEWLARKFDCSVIITVRHPAAFAGSLKAKNWTFPFSHLINQPLLIDGPLSEFRNEIEPFSDEERDIVDQAILLWKIFHTVIANYRDKYDDWIFVRHEDIARSPVESFSALYSALGLEFTDKIERIIRRYSKGPEGSNMSNPNGICRDSASVIYNWKERLTIDEIERVRKRTAPIANEFYSDSDW